MPNRTYELLLRRLQAHCLRTESEDPSTWRMMTRFENLHLYDRRDHRRGRLWSKNDTTARQHRVSGVCSGRARDAIELIARTSDEEFSAMASFVSRGGLEASSLETTVGQVNSRQYQVSRKRKAFSRTPSRSALCIATTGFLSGGPESIYLIVQSSNKAWWFGVVFQQRRHGVVEVSGIGELPLSSARRVPEAIARFLEHGEALRVRDVSVGTLGDDITTMAPQLDGCSICHRQQRWIKWRRLKLCAACGNPVCEACSMLKPCVQDHKSRQHARVHWCKTCVVDVLHSIDGDSVAAVANSCDRSSSVFTHDWTTTLRIHDAAYSGEGAMPKQTSTDERGYFSASSRTSTEFSDALSSASKMSMRFARNSAFPTQPPKDGVDDGIPLLEAFMQDTTEEEAVDSDTMNINIDIDIDELADHSILVTMTH